MAPGDDRPAGPYANDVTRPHRTYPWQVWVLLWILSVGVVLLFAALLPQLTGRPENWAVAAPLAVLVATGSVVGSLLGSRRKNRRLASHKVPRNADAFISVKPLQPRDKDELLTSRRVRPRPRPAGGMPALADEEDVLVEVPGPEADWELAAAYQGGKRNPALPGSLWDYAAGGFRASRDQDEVEAALDVLLRALGIGREALTYCLDPETDVYVDLRPSAQAVRRHPSSGVAVVRPRQARMPSRQGKTSRAI
jgi:hypothetical protein